MHKAFDDDIAIKKDPKENVGVPVVFRTNRLEIISSANFLRNYDRALAWIDYMEIEYRKMMEVD